MSSSENNQIEVGKVRDAHGMKGELFLILFAKEAPWLPNVKTLKFKGQKPQKDGKHQNFEKSLTIKSHRPHKAGLIVKFEEVNTRTEAEGMIGFIFSVPETVLQSQKGEEIFLSEVLGFEVLNDGESIGKVAEFSSNGAQDLLLVKKSDDNTTHEIPMVPEFIKKIDWKKKVIEMVLPEGLLD